MDYIAHMREKEGLVSLSLIKDGSVSAGFYEWGHHSPSLLKHIRYTHTHLRTFTDSLSLSYVHIDNGIPLSDQHVEPHGLTQD